MKKLYKFKRNFPLMKNTWQRTLRFYRQVMSDWFFGLWEPWLCFKPRSLVLENPGCCWCCVPNRFCTPWEPWLMLLLCTGQVLWLLRTVSICPPGQIWENPWLGSKPVLWISRTHSLPAFLAAPSNFSLPAQGNLLKQNSTNGQHLS
jgi:hypothetical protein